MHPLRSTLLYVLVVQTIVALSAHHVLRSYSGLLHLEPRDARGVDERLLAILSIAHVSSHCIILVLWAELRHVRTCRAHVILFVKTYGHMLGANPFGLWTRCMPWFSVIFTFVLAPCLMFVWCIKILKAPLLLHGPSHLFVLNLAFTVLAFFAQACNVVREFASAVAAGLKEELDTGRMTADRLEEFRLAWISLRQLTTDLGSMPLTGLSLIFYLLLMTTLTTYQAAVSFYNNYTVLFVATCCILVLTQFALLHVCDVAHRLQDVMSDGFCEPLESKSWRGLPADLLTEHQQFLRTITTNPAEVTFAGVVSIKRSTYLSIMAAIATYLIVLFQLRMADEDLPTTPLPPLNTTDSSLDSVFRSRT